jgi:flavin reductase (DIM6/NTAB) family NADH-FMN oxidoreductase RutF
MQDLFRAGMRRVSGAVTVVTTVTSDGERRGVTATAVCSLSVDPPSVVACINRETWVGRLAPESGVICVNVLASDQQPVAEAFAGRAGLTAGERFTVGGWRAGATGAPLLDGAIASFDCRLDRAVDFATHVILIGTVAEVRLGPAGLEPLVYVDGAFATVVPPARSGQPVARCG